MKTKNYQEFQAKLKQFDEKYPELSEEKKASDKFFNDFHQKLHDKRANSDLEFGIIYKSDGITKDEDDIFIAELRKMYKLNDKIKGLGFDPDILSMKNTMFLRFKHELYKNQIAE